MNESSEDTPSQPQQPDTMPPIPPTAPAQPSEAPTPNASASATLAPGPSAASQPAASAPTRTRPSAQRGIVKSIHYTLSYLVSNAEAGPAGAIVLLHDLPGGAFSWESVLPTLAATGRAVYAFDMLGYGQSEHPWPSDTSIWGHADCLQYAIEALRLTDMTLVGIGLGGGVAQVLATRLERKRVARLALINSYMYSYAFAPAWPLPDMVKSQDPEAPRQAKMDQAQTDLGNALAQASMKGLSAERKRLYLEEWNSHLGMEMLFQHIRLMLPTYINAVSTDVRLLPIPLLLIWSEQDAVTPALLGERMAAENPHARLELLQGAGHLALEDDPATVARLLADFTGQTA